MKTYIVLLEYRELPIALDRNLLYVVVFVGASRRTPIGVLYVNHLKLPVEAQYLCEGDLAELNHLYKIRGVFNELQRHAAPVSVFAVSQAQQQVAYHAKGNRIRRGRHGDSVQVV